MAAAAAAVSLPVPALARLGSTSAAALCYRQAVNLALLFSLLLPQVEYVNATETRERVRQT